MRSGSKTFRCVEQGHDVTGTIFPSLGGLPDFVVHATVKGPHGSMEFDFTMLLVASPPKYSVTVIVKPAQRLPYKNGVFCEKERHHVVLRQGSADDVFAQAISQCVVLYKATSK